MIKMKKVMVRAWEIAREGAKKFGGKVIDYLAEALRMAWAEFKMAVANERGSVKLVGTEKQVKWANDIRDKYMKAFDEMRSEEHTSELQSRPHLVCRLLLEKKN